MAEKDDNYAILTAEKQEIQSVYVTKLDLCLGIDPAVAPYGAEIDDSALLTTLYAKLFAHLCLA